jgi:glycosyltransferase involved in cell wall biosynthesis
MKIHIIAPALPPSFDAIGDYTALLSRELARRASVKVLLPYGLEPDPIPAVVTAQVFDRDRRGSVRQIKGRVETDQPDWVLLQFNQFSYGRWGLNPWLPLTMKAIKRRNPSVQTAVMMHENFVPPHSLKNRVMRIWQRWQFCSLIQTADRAMFSIQPWVERYGSWFPGKTLMHLPVGSNIPVVQIGREEARERLEISSDTCVLGIFGTFRDARMMELMRKAALKAQREGHKILVLYVGPHGESVRNSLVGIPVLGDGPFPPEEVSRRFAAMDVYLSPYIDGVSTRRGAMMAALQHGIATVGTSGHQTDSILLEQDGTAFLLAPVDSPEQYCAQTLSLVTDAQRRLKIGSEAARLYEREFAWERIADRLMGALMSRSGDAVLVPH